MQGAQNTFTILQLNLTNFTLNHGPGSMDCVGKSREPGCSHAVQGLSLLNERSERQTVHGLPVQSRVAAAIRAVPAICAMILAHMVMNRGEGGGEMQNRTGAKWTRAAGMGPRQRQAGKAWQGRCSKQPANEVGRHGPCSKTASK